MAGAFNRRGVPALYTSLAPLTAIRETEPLGRPLQPLTLCAYEVDAEPVFDALDERECRRLGVDDPDLACPAWEAEMLAGLASRVADSRRPADRGGLCGACGSEVFAPGAGDSDLNLVMWKWGESRPARVVLIDDEGRLSGIRAR